MTTDHSPKSKYKHVYTSPYNSPSSPRADHPAVASSRDQFCRENTHKEPNHQIIFEIKDFCYTKTYKSLQVIANQFGRYTAVSRGWVVGSRVPGSYYISLLVKGVLLNSSCIFSHDGNATYDYWRRCLLPFLHLYIHTGYQKGW